MKYNQIVSLLRSIKKILDEITGIGEVNESTYNMINVMSDAVKEINSVVVGADVLENYDVRSMSYKVLDRECSVEEYRNKVMEWITVIGDCVEEFSAYKNDIDHKFYQLMKRVELVGYNGMLKQVIEGVMELRRNKPEEYQAYCNYYTKYQEFWGGLNLEQNEIGVIEQRVRAICEHKEDFIWLYKELEDYRSKKVLCCILMNYVSFDLSLLEEIRERNFSDYFDFDLIPCTEQEEVFVDVGAYIGDSAVEFIEQYNSNYKKIYCYEVTPESFKALTQVIESVDNIEAKNKGVGKEKGVMYLERFAPGTSSSNKIKEFETEDGIAIDVVTLDEDIQEKITWIKMDIEGGEQAAILGAARHIKEEKPKLTICTYHNNEDIWKIPRMVKELNPEYKMYMRYNGTQIGPSEYVLYGI